MEMIKYSDDWINVDDKPPLPSNPMIPFKTPYLTYDGDDHADDMDEFLKTTDYCEYHLAYYSSDGKWYDKLGNEVPVTHWKPIYPPSLKK